MKELSFLDAYPHLKKTCEILQSSFFYKDIEKLFEEIPINKVLGEELCLDAFVVCNLDLIEYEKRVKALPRINLEFLKLQAKLEKERKYLYSTFSEVEEEVFRQKEGKEEYGVDYLWGLYFSQIFWVTHHKTFLFFLDSFCSQQKERGSCLDVPVGSGMFLAQFLQKNKLWSGLGVDLSESSITIASELLKKKKVSERTVLKKINFFDLREEALFDSIICTEFLEHVEKPQEVLGKLFELLKNDGSLFLTTVVWAAFSDHIFLYRNVNEIRHQIKKAGFVITSELVQPIFEKDRGKEEDSDIALNYAVILKKKNNI